MDPKNVFNQVSDFEKGERVRVHTEDPLYDGKIGTVFGKSAGSVFIQFEGDQLEDGMREYAMFFPQVETIEKLPVPK